MSQNTEKQRRRSSHRPAVAAVVTTPFQLLNTEELFFHLGIATEQVSLLLLTYRDRLAQMKWMAARRAWAGCDVITIPSSFPNFVWRTQATAALTNRTLMAWNTAAAGRLKRAAAKARDLLVPMVVIGDYCRDWHRAFARLAGPDVVYAVDDGFRSNLVDRTQPIAFDRPTVPAIPAKGSLRDKYRFLDDIVVRWRLGAEGHLAAPVTFFTCFSPVLREDDIRIENRFPLLRSQISARPVSNHSLFIGQPLVELGVLSEKNYRLILQRAAALAPTEPLCYVPHPAEKSSLARRRCRELDIEFRSCPAPIEVMIAEIWEPPGRVISVTSSGLVSLKHLLPSSVKLFALRPSVPSPPIEAALEALRKQERVTVLDG